MTPKLTLLLNTGLLALLCSCSGGDTDTDDTDTGDTDTGDTDTGDTDTDTNDTGIETPTGELSVLLDAMVVLPAAEEGELSIRCIYSDEDLFEESTSATIAIEPAEGVTGTNGAYSFENSGAYTATCSWDYGDGTLEASAEVLVINDVVSRNTATVTRAFSEAESGLIDILISNGGADEDLVQAFERLSSSKDYLPTEERNFFRNLPDALWPSEETLGENGITRNTDDDALSSAIQDVAAAVQVSLDLLSGIDPSNPSDQDLQSISEADEILLEKFQAFSELEPTIIGWRENETSLEDDFLGPIVQLQEATVDWHLAQLRHEAEGVVPPFGLLNLTVGMAAKSSLRMNIASIVYRDAIRAVDASINNLIAMALIETALPPQGDIEMTWIQASSSVSIALPGYETWIYGHGFSDNPGLNKFFIVGTDWQGEVDTLLTGCGSMGGSSLMDKLEARQTCLDGADEETGPSSGLTIQNDGVLGEKAIYLGPFPDICGSGWIPVTIGIMAWNMENGARTEFSELTCLP